MASVETVTIIHPTSGKEWEVLKGQLSSCSPVFAQMFSGEFEETSKNIVKIDDFEPEALSQFIDLVEFPRRKQTTFKRLAQSLNLTSDVVGFIDKYDATQALIPLIVQLVEASPNLSNIATVDNMVAEIKWNEGVLQHIVFETMGCEQKSVGLVAKSVRGAAYQYQRTPVTKRGVLSTLSSSTLADVLVVVNRTPIEKKKGKIVDVQRFGSRNTSKIF